MPIKVLYYPQFEFSWKAFKNESFNVSRVPKSFSSLLPPPLRPCWSLSPAWHRKDLSWKQLGPWGEGLLMLLGGLLPDGHCFWDRVWWVLWVSSPPLIHPEVILLILPAFINGLQCLKHCTEWQRQEETGIMQSWPLCQRAGPCPQIWVLIKVHNSR